METGSVCANWITSYNLIKEILEVMTRDQTLVVESSHLLVSSKIKLLVSSLPTVS